MGDLFGVVNEQTVGVGIGGISLLVLVELVALLGVD